ncbi:uncharacterized protein LOC120341552 [Styela clava]
MDFNARLIDSISSREPLYNQYHVDYKNRIKTDQLWKDVAMDVEASVEHCKTRWNSLRTTYGKKHREREKIPSGSAASQLEKWPYYYQLSFLDPLIKHRKTVDNLPQACMEQDTSIESLTENTSEESIQLDLGSPSLCHKEKWNGSSIRTFAKRKRSDRSEVQAEMVNFLRKSTQQLENTRYLDKFEHFGNLVAAQLRSRPLLEAEACMKDMSIVLFRDIVVEVFASEQGQ